MQVYSPNCVAVTQHPPEPHPHIFTALFADMNADYEIVARFDARSGFPPIHSSLRGLDQVRLRLPYLTSLEIGPVPASKIVDIGICTLFQEYMPALETLILRATYAPGSTAVVGHVPQPNLQCNNLPSLRTLVLDGVGLPATGILGFGLHRLELLNYPSEDHQCRFPQLIGALAFTAGTLKELHIRNYLRVANLESLHQPPYALVSLSRLVIHDSLPRITHLLPHLHIPQATDVRLSTEFLKYMIDGGKVIPALHTMLPPSYHALDIPSLRPETVTAFIGSDRVIVTGMGSPRNRHVTCIEGTAKGLSDPSTRAQAYARTVESLGRIFSTDCLADVKCLAITGDFSTSSTDHGLYVYDTTVTSVKPPSHNGIMYPFGSYNQGPYTVVPTSRSPVPDWMAVLAQFHTLDSLTIVDCGGAIPPESFALALAGNGEIVCCPQLQELRLEGVRYDERFFNRLAESLDIREEMNTRLRTLTVILSSSARRSIAVKIRETFLRYVGTVSVEFA